MDAVPFLFAFKRPKQAFLPLFILIKRSLFSAFLVIALHPCLPYSASPKGKMRLQAGDSSILLRVL